MFLRFFNKKIYVIVFHKVADDSLQWAKSALTGFCGDEFLKLIVTDVAAKRDVRYEKHAG